MPSAVRNTWARELVPGVFEVLGSFSSRCTSIWFQACGFSQRRVSVIGDFKLARSRGGRGTRGKVGALGCRARAARLALASVLGSDVSRRVFFCAALLACSS